MNERLRELRNALKLTQTEFAKRIGIGASAISEIEKGRNTLSGRNIAAICRVFNVSEDWLRYNKGEMFAEPKDGLEKLREEYDLNDGDIALIKSFLELPAEMRQMVLAFGRNFAKNMALQLGIEPPNFDRKPDDEMTVAEKRRIVNAELDAEEKKKILSRSTGTSGLRKSKFS